MIEGILTAFEDREVLQWGIERKEAQLYLRFAEQYGLTAAAP